MKKGGQKHTDFHVSMLVAMIFIIGLCPSLCDGVMDVRAHRRDADVSSHTEPVVVMSEPAPAPQLGLPSKIQMSVSMAAKAVEKETEELSRHGDEDEGDEYYYYYYYYGDDTEEDIMKGEGGDDGSGTSISEDEDAAPGYDDVANSINERHYVYPGDPGYHEKCRKRRTREMDTDMEHDMTRSHTEETESEMGEGTMRHKSSKDNSKKTKGTKAPYATKSPKTYSPTKRDDCAPTRYPTRYPTRHPASPGSQPTRSPQPTVECDYNINPNCPKPTNPTGQDSPAFSPDVGVNPTIPTNGDSPQPSPQPSIRRSPAPTIFSARGCYLLDCPRPTNPTD